MSPSSFEPFFSRLHFPIEAVLTRNLVPSFAVRIDHFMDEIPSMRQLWDVILFHKLIQFIQVLVELDVILFLKKIHTTQILWCKMPLDRLNCSDSQLSVHVF